MITPFSAILRRLKLKEQAILSTQNITHGPTIGDMYEGLTHDVLSRAIPSSAGLRLVEGFVVGPDKTLSPQIDCMLVRGDGEQIPYTDHHKWPVKDVIAVFEIKKTFTRRSYRTQREQVPLGSRFTTIARLRSCLGLFISLPK
jgi:hypothetical protein